MTTTGLDLAKTSRSVIARAGDEVWQIEEIGKSGGKVFHVGSYWVVDPFWRQIWEKIGFFFGCNLKLSF